MWWWILALTAVASDEVERRYSVLPLPTIDYTPETGLAGGVVVLATGHPFTDARQSVLELEGTLTTQRQRILTTDLQLFFPSDRLLLSLSAAVMRFPEDFCGLQHPTRRRGKVGIRLGRPGCNGGILGGTTGRGGWWRAQLRYSI